VPLCIANRSAGLLASSGSGIETVCVPMRDLLQPTAPSRRGHTVLSHKSRTDPSPAGPPAGKRLGH
jgi:hypothetical protein